MHTFLHSPSLLDGCGLFWRQIVIIGIFYTKTDAFTVTPLEKCENISIKLNNFYPDSEVFRIVYSFISEHWLQFVIVTTIQNLKKRTKMFWMISYLVYTHATKCKHLALRAFLPLLISKFTQVAFQG